MSVSGGHRHGTEDTRARPEAVPGAAAGYEHAPGDAVAGDDLERYRRIVGQIPAGIQECDTSGMITFNNPAHARMKGCAESELIGKKIWDFAESPAEAQRLKDLLARLVRETPPPAPYIARERTRQGNLLVTQVDWDYLRDDCGQVTGLVATVTDITERQCAAEALGAKKAELERHALNRAEQLEAVVERLRNEIAARAESQGESVRLAEQVEQQAKVLETILSASPYLICMFGRDHRYLYASQAIAGVLGIDRRAMAGKTWRELGLLPEAVERHEAELDTVFSTGNRLAGERQMSTPRGVRTFKYSIDPVRDSGGTVTSVVITAEDITDWKRKRQQLLESEKLAATGRIAARIAHEINNPLAGILNSFLLVKDAIPESHPHFKYVERIEREIHRIARIVRQMFDLHRPNQPTRRSVDLKALLDDVVSMIEIVAQPRAVGIEVDTSMAVGRLETPEDPLRQVLYNVAINAVEASPPGEVVRIFAAPAAGGLVLCVQDQGPGIPQELESQVYEPFFTTKDGLATGGLGLGLSISRAIVESFGGSIDFECPPGRGTIFRIHIPYSSAETRDDA